MTTTARVDGEWHARSPDDALEQLESSANGLASDDARRRLDEHGPNALEVAKPTPWWRILADQLKSVVVLLLFAAAAISWAIGDPVEALAIGAVLLINTILGFVTELRARRAMEALLQLEAPHARVVRDGSTEEIDARELVPGDVILVEAGDSIPADARLLKATELRTNEAPLTGESLPVDKDPRAEVDADAPVADRATMIYKATTVAAGNGRAVVVGTGMQTEVGKIGTLVGGIVEEETPLERRLDALGRRLIWVTLGIAAAVIGLGVLRGIELLEMARTGIALAIAAIPEGLPAVATIALAVGVRRMAKRNALVRRLPAVESLGSATVVCADKTGTLTGGQMTVTVIRVGDRTIEVTGGGFEPEGTFEEDGGEIDPRDDELVELALRIGALANRAEVLEEDGEWRVRGDPTEGALLVAARKAGLELDALRDEYPETGEVPFSSERKLMATFHESGGKTVAYVKGAPGTIVERSGKRLTAKGEERLDDDGRERLLEVNRDLAGQGLRVLAVACREVKGTDESQLKELTFVALVGMADPPADGVKETIARFRDAGIRTVMITGDQRRTAAAVASELGLIDDDEEVLDGSELQKLSERELPERVHGIGALSRVSPEHKLTIVEAYQDRGDIVAMLGDGVNDAAALKKADIGVAMGIRGTDVAKEAADIVLEDDRFVTIGAAIEQGRIIFDNIRKFVFYLFSCNVAEVLVIFLAIVIGLPQPLRPLQLLWLNIITDTFPALSLAAEPGDPDVMQRPPRDPEEAILSRPFVREIAIYGVLITAVTLGGFVWALERDVGAAMDDGGTAHAITVAFMILALAQIFHLGNARAAEPVLTRARIVSNRWAIGAVVLTVGLQLVALYTPLSRVLGVVPLALADWMVIVPLALLPFAAGQIWKFTRRGTGSAER